MSKADRGVYQPSSESLDLYDVVEDDEDEGRSRLPLLIIVALLVLAAFTGVVWLAYNQGVQSGRSGAPVIVSAPTGPVKTAADNTTGQTPYSGLKVYDKPVPPDEEAESSTLAAPPPAVPDNPAPVTQNAQPSPPPEVRLSDAAPQKAPAVAAAAAAVAPPPAQAPVKMAAAAPVPAPAKSAPPPPAAAAVAPPKAAAQASTAQTSAAQTLAAPAKAPAAVPAPAAPVKAPAVAAAPLKATQPPAALQPAKPVATASIPPELAVNPAAPKPAAVSGGGAMLQIGAYESEDLAKGAWTTFQAKHAGSLGGASYNIQRADLGAKGIWFRLRAGPFADKGAANAACDKLKAEGAGCFAAAP